jgi:histidinol phosphatase-like enzyme
MIQLVEKNVECIWDFGVEENFINQTQKSLSHKEKNWQIWLHQIENFCWVKTIIDKFRQMEDYMEYLENISNQQGIKT